MSNSYLNTLQKNYYSTGSTSFNNSIPFQQKSISQIKQENEQSKQYNRSFIETMYRSGNKFKYDLSNPYNGTYRAQLKYLENRVLGLVPEIDFEKNRLNMFHTQCINLRTDMKNDYKTLKDEMQSEVDNLQLKLMKDLNLKTPIIKIGTNTYDISNSNGLLGIISELQVELKEPARKDFATDADYDNAMAKYFENVSLRADILTGVKDGFEEVTNREFKNAQIADSRAQKAQQAINNNDKK